MADVNLADMNNWSRDPDKNKVLLDDDVSRRATPGNPTNEDTRTLMAYMKGMWDVIGTLGTVVDGETILNTDTGLQVNYDEDSLTLRPEDPNDPNSPVHLGVKVDGETIIIGDNGLTAVDVLVNSWGGEEDFSLLDHVVFDFGNQNVAGRKNFTTEVHTKALTGTTIAANSGSINPKSGSVFTMNVTQNRSITIKTAPSGCEAIAILMTNGGDHVITWPAKVHWPGNTPPVLTSGGKDLIYLLTPNGGTDWYGYAITGFDKVAELVNAAPTLKSFTYNIVAGSDSTTVTANALSGSTLGDGTAAQHTFAWGAETAAHGTVTKGTDGAFTYELDSTDADVTGLTDDATLTETFTYTYSDADEDTASARIKVVIEASGATAEDPVENQVPTIKSFTHTLTEDGPTDTVSGNALSGSTLGDGTAQQHTFAWGNQTAQYGTMTKNSDGTYTYVLDNTNATVQALNAGQTLSETFKYTYKDQDNDTVSGKVVIKIKGADEESAEDPDTYTFEYEFASPGIGTQLNDISLIRMGSGTEVKVDWGDGTGVHTYTDGLPSYLYREEGTYHVKMTASRSDWESSAWKTGYAVNNGQTYATGDGRHITKILTPLPPLQHGWGSGSSTPGDFRGIFEGFSDLTYVCDGVFANLQTGTNTNVVNIKWAFRHCTSLTSLSSGLFTGCPKCTSLVSAFEGCSSLATIGEDLFAPMTYVTDFTDCFKGCAIVGLPRDILWPLPADVLITVKNMFGGATIAENTTLWVKATKLTEPGQWLLNNQNGATLVIKVPDGSLTESKLNTALMLRSWASVDGISNIETAHAAL